jgi:hypothetical protein
MEYGEAIRRPNAGGIKQAASATENEVYALPLPPSLPRTLSLYLPRSLFLSRCLAFSLSLSLSLSL